MTKPDKAHKIERITAVLDASPVALSATSIAEIIHEPWCLTRAGKPYGEKVSYYLSLIPDAAKMKSTGLWTFRPLMRLPWPSFIDASLVENARRIHVRALRNFAPD